MVGEDDTLVQTEPAVVTAENPAPGQAEVIKRWLRKIEAAKKHDKTRKAFDRMEKCQQIAAFGAYKEWLEDETRYVVPILNRHVNQAVSHLYAKNPKAEVRRRERMVHTVWDGTREHIQNVGTRFLAGDPMAAEELMAINADIQQAQAQENLMERAARTLGLLYEHQVDEQPFVFKTMLKALVRRTKVNSVGWLKINAVRLSEMRPETASIAEDSVAKQRTIARLQQDLASGDDPEAEQKAAQLSSLLADMDAEQVVREQVVFDYPRSSDIILDPNTRHLKTLYGAMWLAHQFDFSLAQIRDIYGIDLKDRVADRMAASTMLGQEQDEVTLRVYEVQDKYTRQVFTICEGYDQYLKAPAEPDIWLERFFNVFPLVFNEIEHDKELYPPSDVWAARHMQFEYNRSREGLREHRIAARPYWLANKGRLSEAEKSRLQSHAAHEIVEVLPGVEGEAPGNAIQAGPTAGIDPNLYEVETIHQDMLRAVGTQEANLGGTSGATATESSIAESSRMSSLSDNVDDLDDFLTAVARATGQVMLQLFSKERVVEIVGPGATWPEMPLTRKQLADEISLEVKAGSSGRPNQAARLANMERAWPALSMLPGINPEPIAETYADLLDIPFANLNRSGALSITAQNAMAKPPSLGPNPEDQGAQGGANAPSAPRGDDGAQPDYPSGGEPPESQPLASSVGM